LSTVSTNFSDTFSNQWLERTLDDSAIRRIDIPEMFLLTDALLILLDDVTNGLVVFPAMIRSQLEQELPFMATENIIMKLVQQGVSRQDAHERIRVLSRETVHAVKMEGGKNDLIERIKKDEFFVSLLFRHCSRLNLLMAFTEAHLGRARWLAGPQTFHWPVCRDC
jgi:adenylosuccinate lyase